MEKLIDQVSGSLQTLDRQLTIDEPVKSARSKVANHLLKLKKAIENGSIQVLKGALKTDLNYVQGKDRDDLQLTPQQWLYG